LARLIKSCHESVGSAVPTREKRKVDVRHIFDGRVDEFYRRGLVLGLVSNVRKTAFGTVEYCQQKSRDIGICPAVKRGGSAFVSSKPRR
jgi:hypothetical protein